MIKNIYILSMCILSLGLNQDKELVIREYMQNGRIDATIKDNNDQQLYLVQLDVITDSLLTLAETTIPTLELLGGPSSYHRIIEKRDFDILSEFITEEFMIVIDDDYVAPNTRDYWVQTIYGSNYAGSSGEIGNTCYCLNASNCVVVGFNDSWYDPFDYYGEAWWNFEEPAYDEIAEVRVYVQGAQCDALPVWSETEVSIRGNDCSWNSNFQATLSLDYTLNGPYVIPADQLDQIWCEENLQPIVGSEDNYTVDFVRMEIYYSCNSPQGVSNFNASNQENCDYVELNWEIDQSANQGYILYRDNQLISQFPNNMSQFLDYQASSNQEHTYCIVSINECGESESNCITGSRKFVPIATENVYVSDGDFQDQIVITWDEVEGNVTYHLYRDSSLLSIIANNQDLIYIDEFVEQQNIYEYCIEVSNECGDSPLNCDLGFTGIGNLGDINLDEIINVLDIVLLLNFILEIEYPSDNQMWLGDMNSDQVLNILDIVELVNLILQ